MPGSRTIRWWLQHKTNRILSACVGQSYRALHKRAEIYETHTENNKNNAGKCHEPWIIQSPEFPTLGDFFSYFLYFLTECVLSNTSCGCGVVQFTK